MLLPYIIQYLESLMTPHGGQLVEPGGFQIFIPIVPPNTLVPYIISPSLGYYAYIGYRLDFDGTMVPNAFSITLDQWGMRPYSGILTQKIIEFGIDHIIPVTEAEPCHSQALNLTPLNQYACVDGYFVGIHSAEDYQTVMDALRRLGTTTKSEELATQANDLLRRLVAPIPSPYPRGGV